MTSMKPVAKFCVYAPFYVMAATSLVAYSMDDGGQGRSQDHGAGAASSTNGVSGVRLSCDDPIIRQKVIEHALEGAKDHRRKERNGYENNNSLDNRGNAGSKKRLAKAWRIEKKKLDERVAALGSVVQTYPRPRRMPADRYKEMIDAKVRGAVRDQLLDEEVIFSRRWGSRVAQEKLSGWEERLQPMETAKDDWDSLRKAQTDLFISHRQALEAELGPINLELESFSGAGKHLTYQWQLKTALERKLQYWTSRIRALSCVE